jgi:hypothetical protein
VAAQELTHTARELHEQDQEPPGTSHAGEAEVTQTTKKEGTKMTRQYEKGVGGHEINVLIPQARKLAQEYAGLRPDVLFLLVQ